LTVALWPLALREGCLGAFELALPDHLRGPCAFDGSERRIDVELCLFEGPRRDRAAFGQSLGTLEFAAHKGELGFRLAQLGEAEVDGGLRGGDCSLGNAPGPRIEQRGYCRAQGCNDGLVRLHHVACHEIDAHHLP
jgi:hypothetical protein